MAENITEPVAAPAAAAPQARPRKRVSARRGPVRTAPAAAPGLTAEEVARIAGAVVQNAVSDIVGQIRASMPLSTAPGGAPDPNVPLRSRMLSDREILEMFQGQEIGEFDIPPEIVPDGMVYEWKAMEIRGQPNQSYISELGRQHWQLVMAKDHPGMFMPKNEEGPIIRKGLVLMKRQIEYHELRKRYQYLSAREQVRDKENQMRNAPQGTGPREGVPRLAPPSVRHTYEQVNGL